MKTRPTARGTLPTGYLLGGGTPSNSLLIDAPFPHLGFTNSLLNVAAMIFRALISAGFLLFVFWV